MNDYYKFARDDEDRILISKLLDKIEFSKKRNKIEYTDFLDMTQINILKKVLKNEHFENYIIFGGTENTDRNLIILYPEKFSQEMVEKNYEGIFKIIKIELPNENIGKYEHRDYLSGIMKLGIKREKFGDILVTEKGANIIILKEMAEYVKNGLLDLIRFRKSIIEIDSIKNLEEKELNFEDLKIIVTSLRLDNFVSEIAKTSRNKASEYIEQGRVLVNYDIIYKNDFKIKENDIITVRGKGKFIFEKCDGETRSGRNICILKKYV